MGEGHGYDRRKEDQNFSQFIGEMEEWKEQSIQWRKETDKTLKEIVDFMEEVRTPRKIIIWTIRAVIIAAIGSISASLVGFVKSHIHFN